MTLKKSLHMFLLSGLAVIGIYVALVFSEFVGMTKAFLYLRHEMGVPITLLRIGVLSVTVFPVAFLAGRGIMLRSRSAGRAALMGVAVTFTVIIGLLQIFVYDWSVLGASLLKVAVAATGLMLVAYRYPSHEH